MSSSSRGAGAHASSSRKQELSLNVPPNFNKLSENLRKVTPNGIQCSIFCGGRRCKYESIDNWDSAHMAINGLFSHWVTDSILAMARPSTELIKKKNLIEQFKSLGIKTIINLQIPGEHASCGYPLESSGFTYDPDAFMQQDIFFFNFGWQDYGEATGMSSLLDIIKVMAFAMNEGKVAVHCHAGLGRTGVLIACYLAYSLRVKANDAIRFVRMKRPNAVQTRGQILCVQEFEQFITPHSIVYCNKEFTKDKKVSEFSLAQYLNRQKIMLHGYESRALRYIPKILHVICERLLQLADCQRSNASPHVCFDITSVPFTRCFIITRINAQSNRSRFLHSNSGSSDSAIGSSYSSTVSVVSAVSSRSQTSPFDKLPAQLIEDTEDDDDDDVAMATTISCSSPDMPSCASGMSELDDRCLDSMLGDGICDQELHQNLCYQELKANALADSFTPCHINELVEAMLFEHSELPDATQLSIRQFRIELNTRQSAWIKLQLEKNLMNLTCLMYEWLEHLKVPIISREDLCHIVLLANFPEKCLKKLELGSQYTIEYLLRFISRLDPINRETRMDLIKRLVASLTHQSVTVQDSVHPSGKGFPKLRKGTFLRIMEFMTKFYDDILETRSSPLGARNPLEDVNGLVSPVDLGNV